MLMGGGAAAQLPRIAPSADGRILLKGDQPFFWMGDTAWRIHRLTPAELDQYLADRRAKGFNVIQGPLFHSDDPDVNGEINPDPEAPNEAWFANIDQVMTRCAEHGLYVAPVLTWVNQHAKFTLESAFTFGQYIGQRYRERSNIACFIISGEFNHPSANVPLMNALATGLQDGLAGVPVIISAIPRWYGNFGGQSSSYDLHEQPWLGMNMHQSSLYGDCSNDPRNLYYMGTHNWLLAEHDWALTPAKPFIDAEATYEQQSPLNPACQFNPNRWPAFGVRRRAYWSVFAGAAGHTYGANGVFQFYRPGDVNPDWDPNAYWFEAINFPGASNMTHLHRLMRSRPLSGRVPAQDLLLAGATELVPDHVHACRAADGSYAMVYVPQTDASITVDMDHLAGEGHRVWWFDAMTGAATMAGEHTRKDYAPDGGHTMTTPASGEDWVLVIDDLAVDFATPGSAPLWTPGDATGDDNVDVNDLLTVIATWGPCTAEHAPCPGDLAPPDGGDEQVDVNDLLAVITNWGG